MGITSSCGGSRPVLDRPGATQWPTVRPWHTCDGLHDTRGDGDGYSGGRRTSETSRRTGDAGQTQRRSWKGGTGAAVAAMPPGEKWGPWRAPVRRGGTHAQAGGEVGIRCWWHGPCAGPGWRAGVAGVTTGWGHLFKRCAMETAATPAERAMGAAQVSRGRSHACGRCAKAGICRDIRWGSLAGAAHRRWDWPRLRQGGTLPAP